MNIEDLARDHQDDHPGYILTDWYDAAFPSYEISLRVLMQDEQPLPPIEEFVLRTLEAGVGTIHEVSDVLGLEDEIVSRALERLHRLGMVIIVRSDRGDGPSETIHITTKGRQILATLVVLRPEEESLSLCLDALTGEYYQHRTLRTDKSVRGEELHPITNYLQAPSHDEIEIVLLKRLWHGVRQLLPEAERKKELLDVLSVEKAYTGYRSMRVLQFVRPIDGAVLVQVYDGGVRSPRHEAALLKMEHEGLQTLRSERIAGPGEAPDPVAEVVDPALYEAAKRKASEVPRLQTSIRELEQQIEQSQELKLSSRDPEDQKVVALRVDELQEEIGRLCEQIQDMETASPTVEILCMIDHRPRMLQALREAKERVIIIAPWLNPVAVNRELRDLITKTIARKVEVWIGYGFGDPDYRERQTLAELEKIQKRRGGQNLYVRRLGDNHSKILICDEQYMITTSFNWLSFAGRKDRGNRHETGTLTTDPEAVRAMIAHWMPLLTASEA